MESLAQETTIQNNKIGCKRWKKTPGGRSVKEQTLKKNNNSAKNVALTII